MNMENPTTSTKICPTCGTRLKMDATRCLVCGKAFTESKKSDDKKELKGPRIPEITLSLPIALGLLAILLAIGASIMYFVGKETGVVVEPTPTVTPSLTATITLTPTATNTSTPLPTPTDLPPLEYFVKDGDLCSGIAAVFDISIQSIIIINNLSADCSLFVGQKLLVPQPTPTPSPLPTSTLTNLEATEEACDKLVYTVQENDTISGIAANYNISIETLKEYNGKTTDVVFQGEIINIPLCQRLPTPGPTPTPTTPPPYLSPSLLQPADGTVFQAANETITLQWASVGALRENESYAVILEDLTDENRRKITNYVTDTKFIVPTSFRPNDNIPHIIRWTITTVRQNGTSSDGNAIWESAGATSLQRVFSWWGTNIATTTPSP
ncbi:MAG: LysM peptidoglycan-binding domain-containing protein [Anaerolineaceae bacterium]|nr:LysM peptidoglycan-binding domain-containing protein [Anaerolineaceae bacterium]